jgi:IS1 family transposase
MNVLPMSKRTMIVAALCEGNAIRAIERMTHVNRDTIMYLGRDVGEGYARLHDKLFVGLGSKTIEVDEAWSFVHKKQARCKPGDPREFGDQYSYVAMDADDKAIIAYMVGKRNEETTVSFALDLQARVTGRVQITSDGWHPYIKAIAIAFGMKVDYAQLIKTYGADCTVETSRRYSPNKVLGSETTIVFGDPVLGRVSTSFIERQNLTLRMLTRRWTRLTNGFSKILRNHAAAMDLYVGYYNLCWRHESLDGATPAMAVGVADHVWTVEELVRACLKLSDPKHPPIRMGSQRYAEVICEFGRCREATGKRPESNGCRSYGA